MQTANPAGRSKWSDISKGMVIIFMIIGHSPSLYPAVFREIIYSFHMPFFFIMAGYWFKEDKYTTRQFLKKKFKRLLVPYLIFSLVFLVIRIVVNQLTFEQIKWYLGNIFYTGHGVSIEWFFVALFGTELIARALYKTRKSFLDFCGKSLLLILVGASLSLFRVHLPAALDVSFTALVFYLFGFMVNKYNMMQNVQSGGGAAACHLGRCVCLAVYKTWIYLGIGRERFFGLRPFSSGGLFGQYHYHGSFPAA